MEMGQNQAAPEPPTLCCPHLHPRGTTEWGDGGAKVQDSWWRGCLLLTGPHSRGLTLITTQGLTEIGQIQVIFTPTCQPE